jgi:hypothetical protein
VLWSHAAAIVVGTSAQATLDELLTRERPVVNALTDGATTCARRWPTC